MTIAVDTRFLADARKIDRTDFLCRCLAGLTEKYPRHQFLYISDKPFDTKIVFSKNVIPVVKGPAAKNSLLLQYWFNYKLPFLLKKYKADVFLGLEGICSLRTQVPQCLVIQDASFLQSPALTKKAYQRFLKKNTPEFLTKAKKIVTVSEFSKSVLTGRYKTEPAKIEVAYGFLSEIFKPLSQKEKETVKESFTGGKEYFLSCGNEHTENNLTNLLKAFSFFKKRQKSNMMLLLAGEMGKQFNKDLKTYKFRNDVILAGKLPEQDLAKVTATAYALVYPVLHDDFAWPPLQAMQCEVPVIAAGNGVLPEICGNAALYVQPGDYEDIAYKMMLVFKDENKAKELVNEGKIQSALYNRDKTIDLLGQAVLKAANA